MLTSEKPLCSFVQLGGYQTQLREFREGGAVVWDTIDGRRARLGLAV